MSRERRVSDHPERVALKLFHVGPEEAVNAGSHDLALTSLTAYDGDAAGRHGFHCCDAEVLDSEGIALFVFAISRAVPVNGTLPVQLPELLVLRVWMEEHRMALSRPYNLVEVGAVPWVVVGATGKMELP